MWFESSYPRSKAIVFYDGHCAFCHALVRFTLPKDKKDLLLFAPLQGETIKEKQIDTKGMNSMILYTEEGETLYKSDAAIALLERLGGLWFMVAKTAGFIPQTIRDMLYDLIAKIRYKLAGKMEDQKCTILPKNYQSKILL